MTDNDDKSPATRNPYMTERKAQKIRQYNPFTQAKRAKFLRCLEKTGNIQSSAAVAGVARATVYALMRRNETFKMKVEMAQGKATGMLEGEAVRRAVEGVEEPVFYKGKEVATVKKYSDSLLTKLLEANDPERYGKKTNVNIEQNININADSAKAKLASLLQVDLIEGEFEDITDKDDGAES